MKKSFQLILLLCLSSFAFIGCNEKEEITGDIDGKSLSKNFVQVYIVNNHFELIPYANRYIHIQFMGNEVIQNNKNDEKIYNQISKQYNDLSFNKKLIPFQNIVLSNKLDKINITCDKAFDAKHPIGSSLNDVVMLCASSCWDYIKNGYKSSKYTIPQELNNLIIRNGIEGYIPIFKPIDALRNDDVTLLYKNCYLYFTQKPEAGRYTFQVSINMEGKSISRAVTMTF